MANSGQFGESVWQYYYLEGCHVRRPAGGLHVRLRGGHGPERLP